MVHAATLLFLVLLLVAHRGDVTRVDRPLSLFRDGETAALGYVLFALLVAVGALHVRDYWRHRRHAEAIVPEVALVLLVVVALTPSMDPDHALASFALMGLVFVYYAARLHLAGSPWLFVHLAAPVLLLAATQARS